jgi:hypothetical protein
VEVNINNGELKMEYNNDDTSYSKIIELINQNGFNADGNPGIAKKNNCK